MKSLVDMTCDAGRTTTGSKVVMADSEDEPDVLNFGDDCKQHLIYTLRIGFVLYFRLES